MTGRNAAYLLASATTEKDMQAMATRSLLTRRSRVILAAALLAASAAGCAQTDPPSATSGSTMPGAAPIDFHGFPYNIQAGS